MLKIALGDLRHRTMGKHSVLMPLGIGCIAAYLKKAMADRVEIRLYEDPDAILTDIQAWRPNVIGLSNYMWNAELNRIVFNYTKKHSDAVCVAGGPDLPIDPTECAAFLAGRRDIDFFCSLDGEVAFAKLVGKIGQGIACEELKKKPQEGFLAIHPETGELVTGDCARIKDMDSIPSPYLSGIMDPWFDGHYIPAIQTARGCPFRCGYCRAGTSLYNKVYTHGLDRVREELTYIAEKEAAFATEELYILDSNFGLFERDERIAEYIGELQEKYGWPNQITADPAKEHHGRVLRMVDKMNHAMQPSYAVQTLNPESLQAITRKNLPKEEFEKAQLELEAHGIKPGTQFIIPLPHETKESFIRGLREVIDSGEDHIVTFTWMMLPGTKLASREAREEYETQSRFRIISRQFGEYDGQKCFEIEEVCCGTSTMSVEDYIQCRGYAFLCYLFARSQYDIFKRHLEEHALGRSDLIQSVFERIGGGKSTFAKLYGDLLAETRNELYGSKEELYEDLSKPENYSKLLTGEVGDNLFRKYLSKVLCDGFESSVDMAYGVLIDLAGAVDSHVIESLNDAKKWLLSVGDISRIFHNEQVVLAEDAEITLAYDVLKWFTDEGSGSALANRKHGNTLRLHYEDKDHLRDLMLDLKQLYGDDPYYRMGRALVDHHPTKFWRSCSYA